MGWRSRGGWHYSSVSEMIEKEPKHKVLWKQARNKSRNDLADRKAYGTYKLSWCFNGMKGTVKRVEKRIISILI